MKRQSFRYLLLLLLVVGSCLWTRADDFKDYYKRPAKNGIEVTPTRHNFSEFAGKLTEGCNSDYEKIRAIYEWICANIDYDTTFSINTAVDCLKKRRGVCQAYCELFYQLAKAVGIRTEIINGISKDYHGYVSNNGHGWIFAYTRPDHGILLDPTWGAGTVDNGTFKRNENCWVWFNVEPEWMILSHYPKDESYQLVSHPLKVEEFAAMQPVNELWMEYGIDVSDIYKKLRKNELSLPQFYSAGEGKLQLKDFPQCPSLQIGETYTFRVKMNSQLGPAIINNRIYCHTSEWKNEGDSIYSVQFMPRATGSLSLCIEDLAHNEWSSVLRYDIEPPTPQNWSKVEKRYPLSIPEVQSVKNLNADGWARFGVDGQKILQLIREQQITELPVLYNSKGQQITIVSVPMTSQLQAGTSYTFSFYPKAGIQWAMVNNGTWHRNWQVADNGLNTMELVPEAGKLSLYMKMEEGKPYWSTIEYKVLP